ncbi:phosphatase PAP2 family protein [Alicyclobacillus fastidiosus]|uniref:Phosphatase PAP2 family protein n=1 Tax=Alicyclobacillus fastidiosus TaxID=392011 RepID=A0ABY6ZKR3_9BACL|nr:phosphatase PAP2 family protein [Alicyclobacillus fastidiosus]WAH43434.1 phosphatase PAP2 family protein [Alicyclobacillus fastidiosus]GMA59587.1 hypothetical protein GCM10025859_00270 [Alicyclobacillus fastidiosus]GMA65513.1 hypothetical protein GCM10025859_59530 [Alicyclobacillus fastidiosus]
MLHNSPAFYHVPVSSHEKAPHWCVYHGGEGFNFRIGHDIEKAAQGIVGGVPFRGGQKMHSPHRRKNLFSSGVFLISFLISFAIFVDKLELHKLLGFDMKIIRVVQARIDRSNTRLMKWFTFLGSPFSVSMLVLFSTIVLYFKGRRREAASLLVANAAGVGFNEVLKFIFRRRRPDIHRLVVEHGYSFPSGHSMGSVIYYGSITYFICRSIQNSFCKVLTSAVGMFMVFMTGMSRIYLGVHYPSDVVSGYAAGGAWLSASIKGFNAVLPKQKRS